MKQMGLQGIPELIKGQLLAIHEINYCEKCGTADFLLLVGSEFQSSTYCSYNTKNP